MVAKNSKLSLSIDKKILLHIAKYSKYEFQYEVPFELSQEGIAQAIGIRRDNVPRTMKSLKNEDLIFEKVLRVEGVYRKRKVYFLTDKGQEYTNNLTTNILHSNISIKMKDGKVITKKIEALLEDLVLLKTLPRKLTLFELIKDTTKSVLGSSNITCEFSIQDDIWQVEFDAMMLRKVFTNLINNAHEVMPNGGIIRIWGENIISGQEEKRQVSNIKNGKYIKITIQDNGLGIPAEHLPLIFDPYFSTKRRSMQKGMGLGLTTVFSIIKKHDGYIHIESEEKVGTTVYLYLPVSESKN